MTVVTSARRGLSLQWLREGLQQRGGSGESVLDLRQSNVHNLNDVQDECGQDVLQAMPHLFPICSGPLELQRPGRLLRASSSRASTNRTSWSCCLQSSELCQPTLAVALLDPAHSAAASSFSAALRLDKAVLETKVRLLDLVALRAGGAAALSEATEDAEFTRPRGCWRR